MFHLPEVSAIREAQTLLAKYFGAPPLLKAPSLSSGDAEVYLKIETGLPTGSFKPRGAIFALAKNLHRGSIDEVTASSTGNHGAAVAFAAKTLGVRATIFLPEGPNPVKRKKIEDLGARGGVAMPQPMRPSSATSAGNDWRGHRCSRRGRGRMGPPFVRGTR
jgi:threonine dehydratase